jgi:hypothetical protein
MFMLDPVKEFVFHLFQKINVNKFFVLFDTVPLHSFTFTHSKPNLVFLFNRLGKNDFKLKR